jgi:hypothetical protein
MRNATVVPKLQIEAIGKNLDTIQANPFNPFIKWYQHVLLAGLISLIIVMGMSSFSCTEKSIAQTKASSTLLAQVALRQQQLASPTAERLAQMQSMGMKTENFGIQRIYIYLSQQLTARQGDELRALGITLYLDSWIPPVGNHPIGFMLADMPVDKLDALAAKDYVVKLDTAETKSEPQPSKS